MTTKSKNRTSHTSKKQKHNENLIIYSNFFRKPENHDLKCTVISGHSFLMYAMLKHRNSRPFYFTATAQMVVGS